jgi:hypothetical protein
MKFKNYTLSIALLLSATAVNAQNFFQSKENTLYWKNRKPSTDYWQQDIAYKIKAYIDEKTDIVAGNEELTYWNNSPDTLTFVYFHLYQNAFQPGSYLDNLQKNNHVQPKYGKYEANYLNTTIDSIAVDGMAVKTDLDNTILKVYLNKPLLSGASIKFNIKFNTFFDPAGSTRRRMKLFTDFGQKHYDGTHWYPRISVYDRKFGWTTDQNLNREFYGDFGTFDVELNFANNFVLDATGILTNENEVLPTELKAKLDIKNFANKPINEAPSEIIKADGTRKVWKFHADNVHDFAFTADPTYRIGYAEWNGVRCIALAQEEHAAKWQNAASYTAQIIKTYSEDIGMYQYPKIIVADARDGMEYPMLTLDGGFDPDYRSLFAHEVGHNWFFGMVGNNETYRAALDEGFTQFLTAWCLDKLEGKYETKPESKSAYVNKYTTKATNLDRTAEGFYMRDAIRDNDMPLNTHSDHFNGGLNHAGGYNHVYSKTATMLYNLQYTLGDSLFLKAMQHYFDQWRFCHPYFEDFRNSVIRYTHVDLNWFFDEWLETTQHIDYGVTGVSKGRKDDDYIIHFKRFGRMQMPIDFQVIANDERVYNFNIPNAHFTKSTPATILPKWEGWDKLYPTYDAHVTIPEGISNVVIDTTLRLADINPLNNGLKMPFSIAFDSKIYNAPDRSKYEMKARPELWYNSFDGIKLGAHFNGGYMNYKHVFDATFWINTGIGQGDLVDENSKREYDALSYRINYRTGIEKFSKNSFVSLSAKSLDGLMAYSAGIEKSDNDFNNTFYVKVKSMYRPNNSSLNYLLYPTEWETGKFNNTVTVGYDHKYAYYFGNGDMDVSLKSSTFGSDYSYAQLSYTNTNKNRIGKFEVNTRIFAQYGTGATPATESALYLAGANPETLMDNKFTRSRGFLDNSWLGYGADINHFQMGGGLNLRGYAGYLSPQLGKDGQVHYAYKGTTGAALNAEVEFDRFIKLHPKLTRNWLKVDTYVFGDMGVINLNTPDNGLEISNLRADLGLGAAFTIKKFGPLQTVNPFTLRVDFPLWLNRAPANDTDYFKMRWVIGINKAF